MVLPVIQWIWPALEAAAMLGVPVLLLLLRRRAGGLWPAAVGAAVFVLFALVLEQLAHTLLLQGGTGRFLTASPWRTALYGALMAGLFEETGRLATMLAFSRVIRTREDAVTCGIGHGGVESCLLGLSVLLTLALDPLALLGAEWQTCLLAVVERLIALCAHVALSVLVFAAVNRRKWPLFPAAVGLHMLLDIPAGLYQAGVWDGILLTEALTALLAAIAVAAGIFAYRGLPGKQTPVTSDRG